MTKSHSRLGDGEEFIPSGYFSLRPGLEDGGIDDIGTKLRAMDEPSLLPVYKQDTLAIRVHGRSGYRGMQPWAVRVERSQSEWQLFGKLLDSRAPPRRLIASSWRVLSASQGKELDELVSRLKLPSISSVARPEDEVLERGGDSYLVEMTHGSQFHAVYRDSPREDSLLLKFCRTMFAFAWETPFPR